jgi:hypothetical protein
MDDDAAKVREARRVAAEWRLRAAQVSDVVARESMNQLAAEYETLARTWLAIAQSKRRISEL